jgi:thiamine pyrophosphate-dependent acetolactate synthase large subunit-like protein
MTGGAGVVSVHQGPGLTNTVTALTEAAKSRTPLLLLAADVPAGAVRSNFRIDQAGLVEAVGAVVERLESPETAVADAVRALRRAERERRAVVLMLPLDVQAAHVSSSAGRSLRGPQDETPFSAEPEPAGIDVAAALLRRAKRPAIVAGRGAVRAGAGPALRALGERTGAVLATSAVANGLFAGDPFDLGISGGFSTPLAAELLRDSDVVLAVGAAMNQWTTRHGELLGPDAALVQVDVDPDAIAAHRPVAAGVVGDAGAVAEALLAALDGGPPSGRRTPELAGAIAARRWRHEPFTASTAPGRIDPRALSIALDDLLPEERLVVVDSGHFMGWPSMYLRVPDPLGFAFPQAFQCVGLGLATAIGAALARPDRLTVAALGDGGALMALPELETLGRLALPMVVVIYDDAAYGAEVHHFRPSLPEPALDLARFPETDFAALAGAAGCQGATVTAVADLAVLRDWLAGPRERPLVLDAKVDPDILAEWLEEAFRGH